MNPEISALLRAGVPEPPPAPALSELLQRSRTRDHRRLFVTAFAVGTLGISVGLGGAAAVGGKLGTLFAPAEKTNSPASGIGDVTTGDRLGCSSGAAILSTEYAPPRFASPEQALRRELDRRKSRISPASFEEIRRSENSVRYEVRSEGQVQAVAISTKVEGGWMLGSIAICSELEE